jgi:dihydropteroate synthase
MPMVPAPVAAPPARAWSWEIRGRSLSLRRPLVMGILNVTPDSFSDGGRFLDPAAALRQAERMVAEGADILDIGGESTRPGAEEIGEAEEIERVLPVLRALRERMQVPLSIDTRRAGVARAALAAGADVVNDVSGLGDPTMGEVVAEAGAGLVLMHMRGTPATMQAKASYDDVVDEVGEELCASLERARIAGVGDERVVIDPGIGFAKTAAHNLELIARLDEVRPLERPLLLGTSRKSFLGTLLGGAPPAERAVATAATCVAGLLKGARIFRVHDVLTVRQALTVAEAIRAAPDPST